MPEGGEMLVMIYGLALLMAVLVELYPTYRPLRSVEDYRLYIAFLQIAVCVLMVYCSWFYGRM